MTAKITPSILNSFGYYMGLPEDRCPENLSLEEYEAAARKDFLNTLLGVHDAMHPNVEKGKQFEADVKEATRTGKMLLNPKREAYSNTVNEVAEDLGPLCIWNLKVKTRIPVGKREVLLSGEIDVMSGDRLVDLKLTGSYEIGKFKDTWQHIIYPICLRDEMFIPKRFQYIITNPAGTSLWKEEYFYNDSYLRHLEVGITGFLDWLRNDPELNDAYWDVFCKEVK